ncbi:putative F420-0 ABC transporter substrate-binding protein [Cellulomonas humilata]|uniref:Putative F420-0 ABC transporter substrate-binding protein n=1 Tax=Cellulomonas humilata TaxID=144055 RepID=A0A7Y6A2Y8_9CELL|nr:putative F420-0 ABC transporter substrate-binding protein [Cellulomonas humilata]NUU18762.1 putative F420-0 ABC transporter substrate-binding protein [Cellulomonas humilata]
MPRTRLVVLATTAALALAACSAQSTPDAPATPTASATFTPVTLDNCGTEVTIDAPPTKVVTIKSTATELLLALGLQDVMIGTAFADGPVPADYAAAYEAIPVVSDKVPGQEALLALGPDFVYGGWESNFSADGAGERTALHDLGIGTYVSPAACKEEGYMPDPLTFDEVADEIREVAAIFGVPERAEELIAEQEATLDGAAKPAEETTALWYSSGSDTPYVGAGIGAPQMIMDAAGLTNIFADVHDTWTSAGWEQVVAADPDVIVLVDATWNTAEKKIGLLETNPATSQLTAVREKRYLTVPFAAGEAGVRNAEAVASLDEQLAELG